MQHRRAAVERGGEALLVPVPRHPRDDVAEFGRPRATPGSWGGGGAAVSDGETPSSVMPVRTQCGTPRNRAGRFGATAARATADGGPILANTCGPGSTVAPVSSEWIVVSASGPANGQRTTAELGVIVFLASDVMLFAPFFAAYFLLRATTEPWPAEGVELDVLRAGAATVVLVSRRSRWWCPTGPASGRRAPRSCGAGCS